MILSAAFNISIPDIDRFMDAVADYTGCSRDQITEDDMHDYIRRHIKPATCSSDVFSILDENVGTKFISSIEGNIIGKIVFK